MAAVERGKGETGRLRALFVVVTGKADRRRIETAVYIFGRGRRERNFEGKMGLTAGRNVRGRCEGQIY